MELLFKTKENNNYSKIQKYTISNQTNQTT